MHRVYSRKRDLFGARTRSRPRSSSGHKMPVAALATRAPSVPVMTALSLVPRLAVSGCVQLGPCRWLSACPVLVLMLLLALIQFSIVLTVGFCSARGCTYLAWTWLFLPLDLLAEAADQSALANLTWQLLLSRARFGAWSAPFGCTSQSCICCLTAPFCLI